MKTSFALLLVTALLVGTYLCQHNVAETDIPASAPMAPSEASRSMEPRRNKKSEEKAGDAAPPASAVADNNLLQQSLSITLGGSAGSLLQDIVFMCRSEKDPGFRQLIPLTAPKVLDKAVVARRYRFKRIPAGSLVRIFHGDDKREIRIDHRSEYHVTFAAKRTVDLVVEHNSSVPLSPGDQIELRLSHSSGRAEKLYCKERTTVLLPPGEYSIEVSLVSSFHQDTHSKIISDRRPMPIAQGETLLVEPGHTPLVHQIKLVASPMCRLLVSNIGPRGVSLTGPLENGEKDQIRHSTSQPEADFWVRPGTYDLFDPTHQLELRQRIVVTELDLNKHVVFAPTPITGVEVILRKGSREPADAPFHHGDIIRGIDGKVLGKDWSYKSYILKLTTACRSNRSAMFAVDRVDGSTDQVKIQIRDYMVPIGKVFGFRPVTH